MNLFKTGFLLVAVSFLLTACGGGGITDPVEYNNKMMLIVKAVQEGIGPMKNAIKSGEYAKAEELRKASVENIDKQLKEVEFVGNFKGDAAFKDATIKTISVYKETMDSYKRIIEIYAASEDGAEIDEKEESALWSDIQTKFRNTANEYNAASDTFVASFINK